MVGEAAMRRFISLFASDCVQDLETMLGTQEGGTSTLTGSPGLVTSLHQSSSHVASDSAHHSA